SFVNTTLAPLLLDTTANRAQIIAKVDTFLSDAVALLERAARLALPSSGWGFIYAWSHQAFKDVLKQIGDLVTRWTKKLTDFGNALNAYDLLPNTTSTADRFLALQAAELVVSSKLDPLLATPVLMRAALPAKANALQNRLTQFQAIQKNGGTSFATVLSSNSAASSSDKVAALSAAAKALLGDDFQIIPEFTVSAAQGTEWGNAINASTSGDLFTYAKTTLKIDFPVDEWFYGAARVRQPLR